MREVLVSIIRLEGNSHLTVCLMPQNGDAPTLPLTLRLDRVGLLTAAESVDDDDGAA